MNEKFLLLLAAQGDPKRAAAIEDYLNVEDWQKLPAGKSLFTPPAGGYVPGPETVRPTIQTDVHPDGIYLVFGGQSPVIFQKYVPGTVTENMKERCTGVAVKLGGKSICISLYNMADGEEITLTAGKDTTGWNGYKDNTLDASADWDGKGNTEHLKAVGLNPEITLLDGQFIPSVAQWRFICLFRKELNQALAELGGDELSGWYWTSTEYSATCAWFLGLSFGSMHYYTKASDRNRVRAVSAFII